MSTTAELPRLPALPSGLPPIGSARLPAIYVEAKRAIAECVRMDECKDWSDKMAALASYARQAEDEELMKMAMRVRARAIRRCGEILSEIEAKRGGDRRTVSVSKGHDRPFDTRTASARNAGLSERQQKDAIRVARVPDDEFEAKVESADPPTITELAERGRSPSPLKGDYLDGRNPEDFKAATSLLGALNNLSDRLPNLDLDQAERGLNAKERALCIETAKLCRDWLDSLLLLLSSRD